MAILFNRSTNASTGVTFIPLNDCAEFIAREGLQAYRQVKWFKIRFIPFSNLQMGGLGTTSIRYTASIYGPF